MMNVVSSPGGGWSSVPRTAPQAPVSRAVQADDRLDSRDVDGADDAADPSPSSPAGTPPEFLVFLTTRTFAQPLVLQPADGADNGDDDHAPVLATALVTETVRTFVPLEADGVGDGDEEGGDDAASDRFASADTARQRVNDGYLSVMNGASGEDARSTWSTTA